MSESERFAKFETDLEGCLDDTNRYVERFVGKVRSALLLPYCDKKNRTFLSGMGTYFFKDADDEILDREDDTDPESVLIFKVLDSEIVGRFSVGEYMNDVTLEDLKLHRSTEPNRESVRVSLEKAFPNEADAVIREMRWDGVMRCWLVNKWGMTIGIETDGYVHS